MHFPPTNSPAAIPPARPPSAVGDRIGIVATFVCVIHCLTLPLLVPIATATGLGVLVSATAERMVLLATVLLACSVLSHCSRRHHHRNEPLALACTGGLLYAVKNLFGETMEPALVLVGGGLIISAHLLNLRLCKPSPGMATELG